VFEEVEVEVGDALLPVVLPEAERPVPAENLSWETVPPVGEVTRMKSEGGQRTRAREAKERDGTRRDDEP